MLEVSKLDILLAKSLAIGAIVSVGINKTENIEETTAFIKLVLDAALSEINEQINKAGIPYTEIIKVIP